MSKRTYGKQFGFAARAVHTGKDVDAETGAIRRPITMANSYELPYDPTDMNWSSADGNLYTRNGGANQKYLEEKLASLEGGEDCMIARIEVLPCEFEKLLNENIRTDIYRTLENLGFSYVTMDLGGYRTGSMNEVL